MSEMSDSTDDDVEYDEGPPGARGRADFVGHKLFPVAAIILDPTIPVNNIIVAASSERGRWLEEAMTAIGEWRATIRSTYIRWAIAINGLFVAGEKYRDPQWQSEKQFVVGSLRSDKTGQAELVTIAQWRGEEASRRHLETVPMLVAYGAIDLFACLEEWLFSMYRVFLNHHPDGLLKGDDFQPLRQLRRKAQTDASFQPAWNDEWQKRLDGWQRKRLYDGLERVLLAFFAESGLKTPARYTQTTVQTWSESLRLLAVLRNLLIHGEKQVNAELGVLCGQPHSLGFAFKEGEPLALEVLHLQAVESFTDQLLTAVNLSLVEHPDTGQ